MQPGQPHKQDMLSDFCVCLSFYQCVVSVNHTCDLKIVQACSANYKYDFRPKFMTQSSIATLLNPFFYCLGQYQYIIIDPVDGLLKSEPGTLLHLILYCIQNRN